MTNPLLAKLKGKGTGTVGSAADGATEFDAELAWWRALAPADWTDAHHATNPYVGTKMDPDLVKRADAVVAELARRAPTASA